GEPEGSQKRLAALTVLSTTSMNKRKPYRGFTRINAERTRAANQCETARIEEDRDLPFSHAGENVEPANGSFLKTNKRNYHPTRGDVSQNLVPKRRKRKLDRQVGRAVVFIDDRVDLDDLKAGHAAVIGDDLHRQVGFAVAGAATDRRAHARRILRIDPIHIQGDVINGGAPSRHAQRFFDHGAHAALI